MAKNDLIHCRTSQETKKRLISLSEKLDSSQSDTIDLSLRVFELVLSDVKEAIGFYTFKQKLNVLLLDKIEKINSSGS